MVGENGEQVRPTAIGSARCAVAKGSVLAGKRSAFNDTVAKVSEDGLLQIGKRPATAAQRSAAGRFEYLAKL